MCIASKRITGRTLKIAAECFWDDYQDDMKLLQGDYDKPPCVDCNPQTVYLCYLTGCECRVFAVWDDMAR